MKTLVSLFAALGMASVVGGAAAPGAVFRAGAATSNITPPIGSLRVGSFTPYPTTHVHDELHARCLVLDDGRTRLALVVCDLLGMHRSVSLEARRLIQAATGIPPENVMVSATHTHSAGSALGHARYVNEQVLDEYQQFLARRIADGVRRAVTLLRPAEIGFGTVEVPEHVINRRWFVREGKGVPNPFGRIERVRKTGAPGPDFTGPAGPVDPTVSFIAVREPSGPPISVYCAYSLHYAGVPAAGHISADYFGMFCRALERLQQPQPADPPFVAAMANATSGDIGLNQGRYRHLDEKRDPYQRSRLVGEDVAAKVQAALAQVTWRPGADLAARYRELDIAWRPIEPELLAWAKEVEARAPRLSSGLVALSARWPTTPDWATRLSYAGRVQELARRTEPAKVPVQVLRIGDICIGTSPCETYAEIGLEFKRRSPFARSFMVQLNHGMIGYLPTPAQFEFGEYSTWPGTNVLEREASVIMLDALLAMAAEVGAGSSATRAPGQP